MGRRAHGAEGREGWVGPPALAAALAGLALLAVMIAVVAALWPGSTVGGLSGLFVAAVSAATGFLVARARTRNPVGWLLLASAVLQGGAEAGTQLTMGGLVDSPWPAWAGVVGRNTAPLLLFVLVPLHFPDGLLPGRRWRTLRAVAVLTTLLGAAVAAAMPGPLQATTVDNPLRAPGLASLAAASRPMVYVLVVAMMAAAVTSLVQRYLRGGRTVRSQVKWLAYAVGLCLLAILASWPAEAVDPRLFQVVDTVVVLCWAGIPAAIGVALLRHHLHDVDRVISRTLVYGTLTVAVAALYIVAVGYLGALLQTGSMLVSMLATGVVAVAFSPLRERLQRGVNRLLYGDRDDPYAAVDRLGRRLDLAASPQQLLDLAAAEVAGALRLPYAAIAAATGSAIVAEHGELPDGRLARIDLLAGGVHVGWLVVGPLADGEQLSAADRGLLDALARPVGATLHAHVLADDLQRSREALVAAREEERSRLHRDLHDGLGPELATISMLAEAALLDDLVERVQLAVADLRAVVHGLRPPAMDALGLLGALRAYATTHTRGGLRTSIEATGELPPLPPAVEVAAYRIATEAITNVNRHAGAGTCTVRLRVDDRRLLVEVVDDGRGLAPQRPVGVGLRSMQVRAAELGGSCAVSAGPEGGTSVRAWLPLGAPERSVPGSLVMR